MPFAIENDREDFIREFIEREDVVKEWLTKKELKSLYQKVRLNFSNVKRNHYGLW